MANGWGGKRVYPKKPKGPRAVLHVALPVETYDSVTRLANIVGMSKSDTVQKIIDRYIARMEKAEGGLQTKQV